MELTISISWIIFSKASKTFTNFRSIVPALSKQCHQYLTQRSLEMAPVWEFVWLLHQRYAAVVFAIRPGFTFLTLASRVHGFYQR
jgi:hypothetical protein